jgi:DNA-binding winged helix-turn-helix (wHTH) protein
MQDVPQDRLGVEAPSSGKAMSPVCFAGLVFDLGACTLSRESGEAIPLTRGEFRLLRLFVSRPGRVLSRDAILEAVANRPLELFDRSVDALVVHLRRKIEPDPKAPRLIVTVPSEGYRFDALAPAARQLIAWRNPISRSALNPRPKRRRRGRPTPFSQTARRLRLPPPRRIRL